MRVIGSDAFVKGDQMAALYACLHQDDTYTAHAEVLADDAFPGSTPALMLLGQRTAAQVVELEAFIDRAHAAIKGFGWSHQETLGPLPQPFYLNAIISPSSEELARASPFFERLFVNIQDNPFGLPRPRVRRSFFEECFSTVSDVSLPEATKHAFALLLADMALPFQDGVAEILPSMAYAGLSETEQMLSVGMAQYLAKTIELTRNTSANGPLGYEVAHLIHALRAAVHSKAVVALAPA